MVAPDDLLRAKEIYEAAMRDGESPFAALVRAGYNKSAASRRITYLRQLGLIESHGHVNVRALRVANALGVSYQQLIDALREHAHGDLRVPMED